MTVETFVAVKPLKFLARWQEKKFVQERRKIQYPSVV